MGRRNLGLTLLIMFLTWAPPAQAAQRTWHGLPVVAWGWQLWSDNPGEAVRAARLLGLSGWPGAPAILLDRLEREPWSDWTTNRRAIAAALRRLGPAGDAAVRARVDALRAGLRGDLGPRMAAVRRLGNLGSLAWPAGPDLIRLYRAEPAWALREAILRALWEVSPDDAASRELLRDALRDPEPWIRQVAVDLWGQQDPRRVWDPAYVALLKDDGLGHLVLPHLGALPGPLAERAAAAVGKELTPAFLRDGLRRSALGDRVENWAAYGDRRYVRALIAHLLPHLADPDPKVRRVLVEWLGKGAVNEPGVAEALVDRLDDPAPQVREELFVLRQLERVPATAVPGLVRQLPKVLDDATRALILDLLGQAGPAARPATAAILDVRKARPDLLGHCAAALAKIDRPAARQLLPVLLAALPRVPAKNAGLFVAAFHDLGPDAAPAVPALTTLLKATAPGERTEILQALGAIGAAPTAELQGLLADPRGTALERQEAVAALARVGPAAVALLEAILAGPDPLLALIAAAGLDRLRPGVPLPAARWQALVEAALRHDRQTRTPLPLLPNMGGVSNWGRLQTPLFQAVAAALGLHPPAAPHLAATTLPTLARPWDEDWILWDDAATVARRLGPAARTAAPFLVRGLAHEGDRPVQPAAFLEWDHVKALVAIGPEAIPALIEGLGDPVLVERGLPVVLGLFGAVAVPPLLDLIMDEELCPYAVTALGRLGAAARPAVPALGALTRHEEFAVRRAAVTALLRIDPAAVPPLP